MKYINNQVLIKLYCKSFQWNDIWYKQINFVVSCECKKFKYWRNPSKTSVASYHVFWAIKNIVNYSTYWYYVIIFNKTIWNFSSYWKHFYLFISRKIGTNENILDIELIYCILHQFKLPDELYCTLNEVIMTLYKTHQMCTGSKRNLSISQKRIASNAVCIPHTKRLLV